MHLVNGHHPGCLELRPKFQGIGEFDGQNVVVFFNGKWFLYTRANVAARGHRQLQVAFGDQLDRFGPFTLVSFVGVPLDADIYFAHVYQTTEGILVAILPIAMPPDADSFTVGGIYIAISRDGCNFGRPILLRRSCVHLRRTFDLPIHYPSLVLSAGQPFLLPLHLNCRARMPNGVPGNEEFVWRQFDWPRSLVLPTQDEIIAAEPKTQ